MLRFCCWWWWFVLFSVLLLNFVVWREEGVARAKGSREGMWGEEWGWDAYCEVLKESVKS